MKLTFEPSRRCVGDMTTEEIQKCQDEMSLGLFSKTESLISVIEKDLLILKDKRIETKQIAQAISQIISLALRHRTLILETGGADPMIRDTPQKVRIGKSVFSVFLEGIFDPPPCPFRMEEDTEKGIEHDCGLVSGNCFFITIRNAKTMQEIECTTQSPHFIGDHEFLLGTPENRLDPKELIQVLELTPESNHDQKIATEMYWRLVHTTSEHDPEEITRKLTSHGTAMPALEDCDTSSVFIQTNLDLIEEAKNLTERALEQEEDDLIRQSLMAQLDKRTKNLQENVENKNMYVMTRGEIPRHNVTVVGGIVLRFGDWEKNTFYQFQLAKRRVPVFSTYDETSISA